MQQSVMYCGTVLPATRQMLTSNVGGVDAAVRHVLWYGVACHPADADEQCRRCGCSGPSCAVVLCAADIDEPLHTACTAPAEERPASAARQTLQSSILQSCSHVVSCMLHQE